MIHRAMRVRVSNPAVTDALAEHLRSRSDAIVDKIARDELEVSLIGSLDTTTMQMEIYLRVRAWESSLDRKDVTVEVVGPSSPTDAA